MNTRTANKTRARLGLAAIAAVTLVTAACGDDSNQAESTTADTTAETTADTMAPETTTAETMAPETTMGEDMAMASEPFGDGCAAVPTDGEGSFSGMADDPAATAASNNPALSTLVTAVTEAGLVDTLNGEGPFTIFAPVNAAFDALPEGALEGAMADVEGTLTPILTYHVIAGESLLAEDLDGTNQVTVNGEEISIEGTTVNGSANIVCGNVPVANGTVHLIDAVLLPGSNVDETAANGPTGPVCSAIPEDGEGSFSGMADDPAATAASNNPALSTLVTAVTEAGLVDTLNGEGPFTIFAPTNDAFDALPQDALEAAMADIEGTLTPILAQHVIVGDSLSADELLEMGTATNFAESELEFGVTDSGLLTVNGIEVGCQNVPVANGTVHIINEVILP